VATNMEGVWGMGSTVSSYATSSRLGIGTPKTPPKGENNDVSARRALADRIEDSLAEMLRRTEQILKENRRQVLALAHALETHKTLTGDDVIAVVEGRPGPLIDGSVYADDQFVAEIEAYHRAALTAHRNHARLTMALPSREPVDVVIVDGNPPSDDLEIWRRPEPPAVAPAPVANPSENGGPPPAP